MEGMIDSHADPSGGLNNVRERGGGGRQREERIREIIMNKIPALHQVRGSFSFHLSLFRFSFFPLLSRTGAVCILTGALMEPEHLLREEERSEKERQTDLKVG